MDDKNIVTQSGYDKLVEKVRILKEEKRPETVARLKRAREMGDLSENSAYTSAREDLNMLDGQIAQIEEMIRNAKVVDHSGGNNIIELGETVVVSQNGKTMTFQIVGEHEADILANKISSTSPIGRSLLGKKSGDTVEVNIPAGKTVYKIVAIK